MDTESNPAVFREIGKRQFVGNGGCLVFRSQRFHNGCLSRVCIATVIFVCQPFTVGVGFDIKQSSGKSECQWRVSSLLNQPSVELSCLIYRFSIFIFHRIALFIQSGHFFVSDILFEEGRFFQFYKFVNSQFLHLALRSLDQRLCDLCFLINVGR